MLKANCVLKMRTYGCEVLAKMMSYMEKEAVETSHETMVNVLRKLVVLLYILFFVSITEERCQASFLFPLLSPIC